jgi:hypothetical protein
MLQIARTFREKSGSVVKRADSWYDLYIKGMSGADEL